VNCQTKVRPPRQILRLGFTNESAIARHRGVREWMTLASAALDAGFDTLWIPSDPDDPDPWMVAATLLTDLSDVSQLGLMVSLRASTILPVAAAHLAQSLQSLSGGRVSLQMTSDHPFDDRHDHLNLDQRLARRAEFLAIFDALWRDPAPLHYRGTYFQVENGQLPDLNARQPAFFWEAGTEPSCPDGAHPCAGLLEPFDPGEFARQTIEHAYQVLGEPMPHSPSLFYAARVSRGIALAPPAGPTEGRSHPDTGESQA
jgi:Luciferase-like monooxygenase